eukprot:9033253-Pyramimonas_sp.AAC.1
MSVLAPRRQEDEDPQGGSRWPGGGRSRSPRPGSRASGTFAGGRRDLSEQNGACTVLELASSAQASA